VSATKDDPIEDAREHIAQAIAELKAANVTVPLALHRAAHALSYAAALDPDKPFTPGTMAVLM
jgi:hypothetical protein